MNKNNQTLNHLEQTHLRISVALGVLSAICFVLMKYFSSKNGDYIWFIFILAVFLTSVLPLVGRGVDLLRSFLFIFLTSFSGKKKDMSHISLDFVLSVFALLRILPFLLSTYFPFSTTLGGSEPRAYMFGSVGFYVFVILGYFFIRPALLPFMDGALKAENQNSKQSPVKSSGQNQNTGDKSEREIEKEQRINEWNARKPKLTFDDVFGMGEFKSKLFATYNRFLTEGGNGILLTGDPGNGKTFMAEAFAGDLGMNFMEVRTNEITSKWVGEGPRNIAEIFEAARRQAPCVIFLDEFDSLMTSRDGHKVGDHLQMANTVLTELAALNRGFAKHQVLILAASNFRDKLDGAGIREGRFDVKLEVPPPDNQARHHLMRKVLASVPFVADDVQRMADRLEGYSVTRVMAMSKQAAYNAKKESVKVDFDLLKKCLREVQGTSGEIMSEKMKTLNDLCLTENLRKGLDDLVSMMKEPEKIEASGGSLPKGLIFYGPPGTGKTVTAQALAHASGWGFISTNSQDLLANVNKIDDIVKKAKEIRPVVVFIDEADGALADRARNPHSRDITAKILAVMDGPKALRDVIFVAATNFPDDIDSAMTRWGRFSEKFDFKPDDKVRLSLINRIIKSKQNIEWKGDSSQFAANMDNASPADIEGFLLRAISKAALDAHRGSKPVVDLLKLG